MKRITRSITATSVAAAVLFAAGCGLTETPGASQSPTDGRSTSTRAANSPSGEAMPVGDLPGWKQVLVDDFKKAVPLGSFPAAVEARWGMSYPDGWPDTSKNGVYAPSKVVSIRKGVMNYHLHTRGGKHLVAAPVPTIPTAEGPRGGLMYGRYAMRFRADSLHGYKTSWLLWPDSKNWPEDGEIDFPEGNLDSVIHGYLHPQGGTTPQHSYSFDTTTTYESWHTAVLEWTAGRVVFYLDGEIVGDVSKRVPNTPMRWVLQTETSTNGDVPANSTAGNVQIDWIAVWRPSGDSPSR